MNGPEERESERANRDSEASRLPGIGPVVLGFGHTTAEPVLLMASLPDSLGTSLPGPVVVPITQALNLIYASPYFLTGTYEHGQ